MEREFTAADAKTSRFRRVFFPTALILVAGVFILASLQSAFSQSGRGPQPDPKRRKTDKSKYPGPTPKIRLPEQKGKDEKDGEDIIRINSDLVNVVVTIGWRPPNASLDLELGDFEILEDGAPQEITNFSRNADQPLKMVMLFDTSYSVAHRLNFERRAAARFFERVIRPQ